MTGLALELHKAFVSCETVEGEGLLPDGAERLQHFGTGVSTISTLCSIMHI